MSRENAREIFECFDRVENYMRSIKMKTNAGNYVPLCKSVLKTAFKGCIMNIKSFTNLYNELILGNVLSHIPTHALSQDHLEVGYVRIYRIY